MKTTKSLLMALILIICSCTNETVDVVETSQQTYSISTSRRAPISLNSMAYTSPSELQQLYSDDPTNVIHYNIARLLAETELIAGANFCLSPNINPRDTWYLTSLPKVVYNYDNTPKYYEFGYVCNGQIVATVTTYAKKEIAGVIAFVFGKPLDYSCPDLDYYKGDYPNRYYGINGTCYLKNCDEALEIELQESGTTDEEELEFMLLQMGEEDIAGMQEDSYEQGETSALEDNIAERDEYWQQIDDFVDSYLSHLLDGNESIGLTEGLNLDNFINGSIVGGSGSHEDIINQLADLMEYQVGYFNTGTLAEYRDPNLLMTHWSGFCGPAACAWVYRGKFERYNGYYLPIRGSGSGHNNYYENNVNNYAFYDYSNSQLSVGVTEALEEYNRISEIADNGLAACFYNETVPFWWGEWQFPLYHAGLNRGFRNATNGQYYVTFTCKPYEWITLNNQPLIIAIDCNHYIVAFGYGVTKKSNGNVKDKYFFVTDNGHTTSPSYEPYMRKKSFWDLHYGLTHE
jgi:hypothetical protein